MKCFKIESIQHGWFECRISKYLVEASDYLGYDISKEFLTKFIKVLKGPSKEWIYVMNEPGAGIIELLGTKDTITISIYSISKPSDELSTEIEEEIKNIEKCDYSVEIDKIELLDSVVTEYSLYETGNGRRYYEINWNDFPQSEYDELKKIAFEANKNLGEFDSLQSCNFLQL